LAGFLFFIQISWGWAQSHLHTTETCGHTKAWAQRLAHQETDDTGFDVKWYFLDLEASNADVSLSGSTTILVEATSALDEVVFELQRDYDVSSVTINGREAVFLHELDEVRILLAPEEPAGTLMEFEIFYSGAIPITGNFFQGINNAYSAQWDQRVTYTLSEPYNAYQWFAAKQVLTDKADSVWIHVTTPADQEVASNGIRQEPEILDEVRVTHKWKTNYPIAYYLISMTIGDYQEYNFTVEPEGENPIFVQNYIYDDPAVLEFYREDIDETADMLKLFSELFGAYPFSGEKYGHVQAPFGGGMEHQTMSLMGNFNFTLIAHELGHQWFGDYVTCGTWQDIWINEGFARYSEYLAIEKLIDRATAEEWRQDDVERILSENGGTVFVPESGADLPSRIFDFRLTYSKGGQLVHMLRHEINDDDLFFRVLREFVQRKAFATGTGDDFVEVLNELTEQDFTWFFEQWYYGGGFPIYDITWEDGADTVWIQSDQTGSYNGAPFFQGTLPFRLTLENGGQEIVRVFQSENNQKFAIPISDRVVDVEFDYENWILKEVNSVRRGGVVGIPLEYRASAKIYPQPATGSYVHLEGISSLSRVQVIDLQGRFHQISSVQEGERWRLDLSRLQAGMYQLRVEDELGGVSLPLVVR